MGSGVGMGPGAGMGSEARMGAGVGSVAGIGCGAGPGAVPGLGPDCCPGQTSRLRSGDPKLNGVRRSHEVSLRETRLQRLRADARDRDVRVGWRGRQVLRFAQALRPRGDFALWPVPHFACLPVRASATGADPAKAMSKTIAAATGPRRRTRRGAVSWTLRMHEGVTLAMWIGESALRSIRETVPWTHVVPRFEVDAVLPPSNPAPGCPGSSGTSCLPIAPAAPAKHPQQWLL